MTAGQWKSVWEIYQTVCSLAADDRAGYADSATGDPEVRREVLALLGNEAEDPHSKAALPRAGQKVGRYEVTNLIGRGGMGEVYAARDEELGRPVALKFVLPDAIGDPAAVRRAIREARAASALNHPNIVTVHDVIHLDSGIAIAMELVQGENLREFCGSPMKAGEVVRLGRQIAAALQAAHASGIVHRDIKPENVMVRRDGVLKILDFGIARDLARESVGQTQTTSPLQAGTLRYMSPEQLRGGPATGASDVFALGIVLCELAAGRHPFAADYGWESAHAIATGDAEPPSSFNSALPPGLDRLILAMLAKEAERRAHSR